MNAGMKLVFSFVSLFMAIILIIVIATQTTDLTSYNTANNESVSIASARITAGALNSSVLIPVANVPTGWRATSDAPAECLPGSTNNPVTFVLKNATGSTLTRTTHYNVTNPGYISVGNIVALNGSSSNTTYVTYAYCDTDYQSGISSSVIRMMVGFLALIALAISIYYMYDVYRDFKG